MTTSAVAARPTSKQEAPRASKRSPANVPGIVLIVIASLLSVVPLLSMFSAALAKQGTIPQGLAFTTAPQWGNFVDAWNEANITTLLGSSVLIVLGVVPVAVIISTMAAYAITVLTLPFGRLFFTFLIAGLTLPFETIITPLYQELQSMGLLNNRIGLCLALIGLNMPFATFWMRAHFLSVPKELNEATSIDGANRLQSLFLVHVPLARPALASLVLLMFLSTWNQFLLTLVLIDDPNKRTMAGALAAFVGKYSTNLVLLNAGALLLMAPIIVVFLLLQKQFVQALLAGSVKG